MKTIAFDLETILDPEAAALLPPLPAPANYKDPEKIAAYIAQKEQERADKLGLDPWANLVCVVGWRDDNESGALRLDEYEGGEAEMLEAVWALFSRYDRFVTFNGIDFDVPVLLAHSLIHGVRPTVHIARRKYAVDNHVDVRAVLSGWNSYGRGTLDMIARRVFGPERGKADGISGSEVQGLWDQGNGGREAVVNYCVRDAELVWDLYQAMRTLHLV